MPKNLIICCDGTNNQFGSENTNVVRLIQVLNRDPARQIAYYDAGVGTMPEPGFVTPIGKWFSKIFGLAFGAGLQGKVAAAYKFLMDYYESGDHIYLFGFSRGAYTIRALAGVLYQFGLLPPGNDNLIPYALRYSKAIKKLDGASADKREDYWNVCREFRRTFSRIVFSEGTGTRTVKIRFLGVWDTVSSVGWVWEPEHYPYTAKNPSVEFVRHAVSLDEHRAFFRQNRWPPPTGVNPNVWEVWFAGVHSDVGGGYPENEGGLWRTPFLWMLREAVKCGLIIRREKVREVLKRVPMCRASWANPQHESLTWKWWIAEVFPKLRKREGGNWPLPRFNLFRRRVIQDGAELHRSLLRRIRCGSLGYQPPNLSSEFCRFVETLERVPETLAYRESP